MLIKYHLPPNTKNASGTFQKNVIVTSLLVTERTQVFVNRNDLEAKSG